MQVLLIARVSCLARYFAKIICTFCKSSFLLYSNNNQEAEVAGAVITG